MSLVEKAGPVHDFDDDTELVPLAEDPFRLGWRYVERTLPDGQVEYDEVPLTLEDLMFPEENDHAVNHPAHAEDCYYLYGCLKLKLAGVPRALVLTDCRVDFAIPGVKPLGPDVSVFLDAPVGWLAATLEVGPLAVRPVLVVEVTSPDTRRQDIVRKRDFYHRANIPYYVVVDSRYRRDKRYNVHLIPFRYTPDGYEPIPLDDQGRLWIEPLGLWFQIEDAKVIAIDGSTGRVIESFVGMFQSREAAEAEARAAEAEAQAATYSRIDAEVQARAATDARLDAEARARAATDARRDAEVQARAATDARLDAEARAQAETAARRDAEGRAGTAEAQVAALQAELRRLRGEG